MALGWSPTEPSLCSSLLVPCFLLVLLTFFYCRHLLDFILEEHTTVCCTMCLLMRVYVEV